MKSNIIRFLITAAFPLLSSASSLLIQPSLSTVPLGNPVSVSVNVAGVSDLYAFQFDITFNPAVLSAASVTEGSLFSGVGVFFSPGFVNNAGGSITFIGDSLSGPGPGISTDGTLAMIMFNSIGVGSSTLTLANIVLLDSSLNDITATVSGASVTVTTTSSTPEPSSLVLVGFGAMLWAIRRRWGFCSGRSSSRTAQ